MKVTRKMVAMRAGVSKESVSYVLNRSRPVSDEIVGKVMRAVEELGYVPDMMARSLNNKKTMSVGVICNDLSNPYYSEILSGLQERAERQGYMILIAEGNKSVKKTLDNMASRRVDGLCFLVFPYRFGYDYAALIEPETKIVVTHNTSFSESGVCHLEPDFDMGIRETLAYLKDAGHTEITMLSAFDRSAAFDNRYESFERNYRELFGKEPRILSERDSYDSTIASGKALAERFLNEGVHATAVLCTNDLMAIGAMKTFEAHGLAVPGDISVVGIDDMEFSSLVTPALTTIGYDKREFGRTLFDVLYADIETNEVASIRFPLKLVVRDSTACRAQE